MSTTRLAEEIAAGMGIPADVPMTDEQSEIFRAEYARRLPEVQPEPRPTIAERLAALEVLASVPVILGPGETLIIRTTDLMPEQMRHYQEHLDWRFEAGELPFRAIVVHGDELAAARTAEPPAS